MCECTRDDKPLISILMAVYNPNVAWLREQLLSLNAQTYPNLRLYIYDDCSVEISLDGIEACVGACITAFPYTVWQGEKNLGSNRAFEELTRRADGSYFAYCDQDDIWMPNKLMTLAQILETEAKVMLVCSDVCMINECGMVIAQSIVQTRRRHIFCSGAGLAPHLLVTNFVIGCTVLVRAEIAKGALPFQAYFVHDQWVAFWAAQMGEIRTVELPLVRYRQHSGNQTGILINVTDKASYFEHRIRYMKLRMESVQERLYGTNILEVEISELVLWAQARVSYFRHPTPAMLCRMYRQRREAKAAILLETFLPFMPNVLFRWILRRTKNGKL